MRRREKYAGVVWLESIRNGDEIYHRLAMAHTVLDGPSALIEMFNRNGYLVEMEMDTDRFQVRIFPSAQTIRVGWPEFAASYTGRDLQAILSAAWGEYCAAYGGACPCTYNTREVVRWVA